MYTVWQFTITCKFFIIVYTFANHILRSMQESSISLEYQAFSSFLHMMQLFTNANIRQVLTITLIFLQPVASKARQEDPSRVNANSDFALSHFFPDVGYVFFPNFSLLLGDLKTRKSTDNSCQTEIHFSRQISH